MKWALLFFMICIAFSTFLTISTALLNAITFNHYRRPKDTLRLLFYSLLENVGFRQYGVICRTWATLVFFKDTLSEGLFGRRRKA